MNKVNLNPIKDNVVLSKIIKKILNRDFYKEFKIQIYSVDKKFHDDMKIFFDFLMNIFTTEYRKERDTHCFSDVISILDGGNAYQFEFSNSFIEMIEESYSLIEVELSKIVSKKIQLC